MQHLLQWFSNTVLCILTITLTSTLFALLGHSFFLQSRTELGTLPYRWVLSWVVSVVLLGLHWQNSLSANRTKRKSVCSDGHKIMCAAANRIFYYVLIIFTHFLIFSHHNWRPPCLFKLPTLNNYYNSSFSSIHVWFLEGIGVHRWYACLKVALAVTFTSKLQCLLTRKCH